MDKINLRKKAKEIRRTLPIAEKSAELVKQIRESEIFNSARHIMLYYPLEHEINLLSLINSDKNFYLPRVNGENLEVCPYCLNDELKKSVLNIFEPCTASVLPDILDLVIVPALMCDKNGYRLGYGGGFYDRFLKGINAKTACAIPCELFVDCLPVDNFDVKVDKIFKI